MLRFTNTFLKQSPIHGLSFFASAKSRKEKVFWALTMLIFGAVLSIQCSQLIIKYYKKETLTKIEIKNHEYIVVSSIYACQRLRITHFLTNPRTYYTAKNWNLAAKLSDFKNKVDFMENWKNDTQITVLVFLHLCELGFWEATFIKKIVFVDQTNDTLNNPNWQMANMIELEKLYHKHNIKIEQMKHQFGIFIQEKFITVKLIYSNGTDLIHEKIGAEFDSMDENSMACLKLNMPKVMHVGPPEPKLKASINFMGISGVPLRKSQRRLTLMISRDNSIVLGEKYMFAFIEPEFQAEFTLSIEKEYISRRHSSVSSTRACRSECSVDFLEESCKCSMMSSCSLSNYKYSPNCSKLATIDPVNLPPPVRQCLAKCKSPKVEVKYLGDLGKMHRAYIGGYKGTMDVTLSLFRFPSFDEVLAFSWEEFVGAIGGIWGIWFGASALSIIHLGFMTVHAIMKRRTTTQPIATHNQKSQTDVSFVHY